MPPTTTTIIQASDLLITGRGRQGALSGELKFMQMIVSGGWKVAGRWLVGGVMGNETSHQGAD